MIQLQTLTFAVSLYTCCL